MVARLGRVTVDLAESIEVSPTPELAARINANVKPPTEIVAGDVYIRAMYVVSDEVNSFGGRFPADELENVARLLIDSPVMVGHRKDKLPIARNFYARVERRGDQLWVKSYFYWLKNADNARDLQENIDGGIYKECSIGFTFHFAECSICARDIRVCEHEPFKAYPEGNGRKTEPCRFDYRKIDRVLETSLVFRGALPNTSVTKELAASGAGRLEHPKRIREITELRPDAEYLVIPYYEGPLVRVADSDGEARVEILENPSADLDLGNMLDPVAEESLEQLLGNIGQLVGYRGKERMELNKLMRFLRGEKSPVTRVELKLFPIFGEEAQESGEDQGDRFVKRLRHRFVKGSELKKTIPTLMTRRGVRIWPVDQPPGLSAGYHYCPHQSEQRPGEYRINIDETTGNALLTLDDRVATQKFEIKGFNLHRLMRGRRFIVQRLKEEKCSPLRAGGVSLRGQILNLFGENSHLSLNLSGALNGRFLLSPVRLNGEGRYVIYRTD